MITRPYTRLVEPFCGGAALFFRLQPSAALIADRNAELINAYVQIRDHPDDLIARLRRMNNSEAAYYRIRERKARTPLTRQAAGGLWTVDIPLAPGRYTYAFVVDGRRFMADPAAPRSVGGGDDFGTPTSVVTVASTSAGGSL